MFPNENASESLRCHRNRVRTISLEDKFHLARHTEPLTIDFNLLQPLASFPPNVHSVQELCGLVKLVPPPPALRVGVMFLNHHKFLQIFPPRGGDLL